MICEIQRTVPCRIVLFIAISDTIHKLSEVNLMASEKILEGKKAKVAALTEMLQDSVSFVLVDYKGISVEDDTKLRKGAA